MRTNLLLLSAITQHTIALSLKWRVTVRCIVINCRRTPTEQYSDNVGPLIKVPYQAPYLGKVCVIYDTENKALAMVNRSYN